MVHLVVTEWYHRLLGVLNPRRMDLSNQVIETWQLITDMLNISEHHEAIGDRVEALLTVPPWKGCHYVFCVCSCVEPFHPMKICKGCWSARYCSKTCQKG